MKTQEKVEEAKAATQLGLRVPQELADTVRSIGRQTGMTLNALATLALERLVAEIRANGGRVPVGEVKLPETAEGKEAA